jgi:DNA-directed RNA polymerase subunit beta'
MRQLYWVRSTRLEGLKENVIVGHLIPAGTGQREYNNIIVGSLEEYESLQVTLSREFRQQKRIM